MSKLPTQEALDLHPFYFEKQFVNPRRSSRLVPQSDRVDLPLDSERNEFAHFRDRGPTVVGGWPAQQQCLQGFPKGILVGKVREISCA